MFLRMTPILSLIITIITRIHDNFLFSVETECVSEDDSDMELDNHNHYKDT